VRFKGGRRLTALRETAMRLLIPALVAAAATPALAQDRLAAVGLGDTAGVDTYEANIHGLFKDAYAPEVRLRAVVEPSFSPEYVVGLRQRAGAYSLFALQPAKQIWGYSVLALMKKGEITVQNPDGSPGTAQAIRRIEEGLPPRPGAVALTRCEAPIEPALAQRLIDIWSRMLAKVRPGEKLQTGFDGEITEFSMTNESGPRVGFTWSPRAASESGLLAATAYAMKAYCGSRAGQGLSKLDQTSGDLAARLEADAANPTPVLLITRQDQAIAAAKAVLAGGPHADGPFRASLEDETWTVQAGTPASTTIVEVDSRTGVAVVTMTTRVVSSTPSNAPAPK
jgi:hypothetical protein